MKILSRLERLEAQVLRPLGRVILVSIDAEVRRTVEADSRPDLPETGCSYYSLDTSEVESSAA